MDEHSHITPISTYLKVYVALMVLMGLTYGAYLLNFRPAALANAIALTIAVTKAVLVVLFFMQVKYSSKLTWVWASAGFIWLIILFSTLGDYLFRIPSRGWQ